MGITVFRASSGTTPTSGSITFDHNTLLPAHAVAIRVSGAYRSTNDGVEASATDSSINNASDDVDMQVSVTTVTDEAFAIAFGGSRGSETLDTLPAGQSVVFQSASDCSSGGDRVRSYVFKKDGPVSPAGAITVGQTASLSGTQPWATVGVALTPEPTGLIAHWTFDEGGTSQTAADSSGNTNNGTLGSNPTGADSNDPTWVCVSGGNALDFDGTDDYVIAPTSASLDITGDKITIAAWVKFDTTFDSSATQDATFIDGGSKIEFWWEDSDGKLHFSLATGAWLELLSTRTSWTANTWYHIVGVYNGTNKYLYINGAEDNSQLDSGNLNSSGSSILISQAVAAANEGPFDGLIDDVRIYDRALSQTEITALAASPPTACIVAHWKFDEGTGQTAADS
ncbi:MAG: LamG domain-containing protein, partial [Pseudomonadales bacterium]